jgi:hypothetical protein
VPLGDGIGQILAITYVPLKFSTRKKIDTKFYLSKKGDETTCIDGTKKSKTTLGMKK